MQKQFEFKGSIISYVDEGTGSPIMLVHGFAEDAKVWRAQIDCLAAHYRVLAPDLPGSGNSLYNPLFTTITDFAGAMQALLEHENITRCIMLGHSMGGYITLAFADTYPQYLQGWGLVHSTAFADSEEKKQNRARGIQLIENHGAFSFIKNTTPNLFTAAYKSQFGNKVAELVEKGNNFSKEALVQYYTAMMNRPDRTHVLRQSHVPVLFVAGKDDVAVPFSDSLKQLHMPATTQICLLEQSGHMGIWEEQGKTNNAIKAFVKYVTELRG